MEGAHGFEMVANPSYMTKKKLGASDLPQRKLAASAIRMRANEPVVEAVMSNSTSAKALKTIAAKEMSNHWTVAGVIAVFLVLALAISSVAIAMLTYFNMKAIQNEDERQQQITPDVVTEMQAQLTKLAQDLTAAKSQLMDISNVQVVLGR